MSTENSTVFLAVAAAALAFAACDAGQFGAPPADPGRSPGTVTLQLLLPSNRSFCDQADTYTVSPGHIAVLTPAGAPLAISPGWCPTMCSSQCGPTPCPLIPCGASNGVAVTDFHISWDGGFYEASTCGHNVGCIRPRFAAAGRYIANMCATPGALSLTETGAQKCTASGPPECIEVPFVIPGPDVRATLSPSPAAP